VNEAVIFIRRIIFFSFISVSLSLVSSASAEDNLVFDFNSAQTFSGLGVQLWPATDHQPDRDALLRDLHVKYVRIGFTTKLSDEQLKAHMSVGEILAAITRSQDDQQSTLFSKLHSELASLHVETHFVFWQVPAVWCNGLQDDAGNRQRINPDHIQDYANWIAANLLYARRFRCLPSTIEMVNEPDNPNGTQFTPEQYDNLLVTVRTTLDGTGLTTVGIEGPGVGSAMTVEAYAQELEKTGHISLLNGLSWHDYDTARSPEPAGFAGVPLRLLASSHRLPISVTEFTSESPQWNRPPFDSGPHDRGPNNAADSPDFAVSVVGEELKLLADGAKSVFYWQAEDPAWTQDAFGLLNAEGQRKPAATALQMLSEQVRPDCQVTAPKTSSLGFVATCFRSEHGLVLAAANLSLAPRAINAQIVNARSPNRVVLVHQFDAHGLSTPVAATVAKLDGETVSLRVPARAVMVVLLR